MASSHFPTSRRKQAELLDACENGTVSDVWRLLRNGAKLSCADTFFQNPLHRVCLGNNYSVACFILMQDFDYNSLLNHRTQRDETPLDIACRLGHLDLVNLLMSKEAPTSWPFKKRLEMLLHVACTVGDNDQVLQILQHWDVDIDARDKDKAVPLIRAVQRGHIEIATTLLAKGADAAIKDKFGNSAFHLVILKEHWTIMEHMLLMYHQSIVDDPNKHGRTPLLLAVVTASEVTPVRTLLTHNADPNIADCAGCTPLFKASVRGQLNMVKALLAAGAEVDRVDEFQRTPLTVASHKGHADLIQLLLEHGAKFHVDNALDPVLEAKETGHEDIADLLTEHLQKKCSPKGVWSMLLEHASGAWF